MEYLEPLRALDLVRHADTDSGSSFVHELVRQLLLAEEADVEGFASREGLRRRGWDGKSSHARGVRYVPRGRGYWELTAQKGSLDAKAGRDFLKRSAALLPGAAEATYVAVSLRPWPGKLDWVESTRRGTGWGDVQALDADDLVSWLEIHPHVHQWATRRVRGFVGGVIPTAIAELPTEHATYVERPEISALAASFDEEHTGPRVLVVWGGPGMGKTTAAISLAHALTPHFPDGQFFEPFARSERPAARLADLKRRVHEAFEGDHRPESPSDSLARSLRGRRVLIVVDDVLDEASVRPLGDMPDGTLLIVTSRSRLSGLLDAKHCEVPNFTAIQGSELFRSSLPPTLDASNSQLGRLVELCDGVPLALRIAATQLALRPDWDPSLFVGELEDERTRLDALSVGDQAVRSSFEISYRALSPEAQRAFCAVSMIPGRLFDAHLLSAAIDIAPGEATKTLRKLQEAALVVPGEATLFDMHDLLRLFSRELAERLDRPARMTIRTVNWLLATSQDFVLAYAESAELDDAADAWFRKYVANLLSAIDIAGAQLKSPAAALGGIDGVAVYLTRQERWTEIDALGQQGQGFVRRLRATPDPQISEEQLDLTEAVLLSRRAEAAVGLEDATAALRFARAAQVASERIEDYPWRSHVWVISGHAFGLDDDWESALACYRQATAIAEAEKAESNRILAGYNTGRTLHRLGRDEEALPLLLEELATMVAAGDRRGEAISRNTVALTLRRLGDRDGAEEMLDAAVREFRNLGDLRNLSHALFDLAVSRMGRNDLDGARSLLEEELAVLEAVEDMREHARTRLYLLRVDLLSGRDVNQDDLQAIERCITDLPGQDGWRAEGLLIRSAIRLDLSQRDAALEDVEEALGILALLQDQNSRDLLMSLAADVLDRHGPSSRVDVLRLQLTSSTGARSVSLLDN